MLQVAEARIVGERLWLEVAERTFSVEGAEIAVTISVGIGETSGAEMIDVDELIARADEQLYVAKRARRNRVCR